MPPEPLILVLSAAILVNVGIMAAAVSLLLRERRTTEPRPAARALEQPEDPTERERPGPRDRIAAAPPSIRLVKRGTNLDRRAEAAARHQLRPGDDEVEQVLAGTSAAAAYNKTVRVLSWAFIIACLVIVSALDLWRDSRPQIIVVLALAGIFVLVVHELMPPTALGAARFVLEGTAAIVFLTMLVVLTGRATSPFFFVYPLLVGGAALVATPWISLTLTAEAAIAYTIAALSGGVGNAGTETLAYIGINLTALTLLAYAGMVISREQRRTRLAAIKLSTVDYLTDLYNRAFFFNALDREIQRSRRFRRGFCLLMMDLDGLKAINDRYGHYQGDLILRGVGQVIKAGLRNVDVPARYGGDEFVALLPETETGGAYIVAEKLRHAVTELVIDGAAQQISPSMSIGVVAYPDDGQTADELMIAADEAMYSSKRLGKNRVVGFGGGPSDSPPTGLGPASYRGAEVPGFRPLPREETRQE